MCKESQKFSKQPARPSFRRHKTQWGFICGVAISAICGRHHYVGNVRNERLWYQLIRPTFIQSHNILNCNYVRKIYWLQADKLRRHKTHLLPYLQGKFNQKQTKKAGYIFYIPPGKSIAVLMDGGRIKMIGYTRFRSKKVALENYLSKGNSAKTWLNN